MPEPKQIISEVKKEELGLNDDPSKILQKLRSFQNIDKDNQISNIT